MLENIDNIYAYTYNIICAYVNYQHFEIIFGGMDIDV